MSAGIRLVSLAVVVAALSLCACSSAPSHASASHGNPSPGDLFAQIPYWQNPWWQRNLFRVIQSVVHRPDDTGDGTTTDAHVTVGFTVANGDTQDLTIVSGTGDAGLDQLVLQQVGSAKLPPLFGGKIDEPHHFELELDVLTLTEWFQYNIYYAIELQRVYPKAAIMEGNIGSTTIDFDYLDGKAENITITKHTNGQGLDRASLNAVERAQFPAPPPAYAGKTLHMEVIVCYSLNGSQNCPQGKNVILVQGTRVRVN